MNHVSNHEENKRECQFKSPSCRRAHFTIKQADTSHSEGLHKKADEVLKAVAEKIESQSQSYRLLPPSDLTRPLAIASLLHCSNIA